MDGKKKEKLLSFVVAFKKFLREHKAYIYADSDREPIELSICVEDCSDPDQSICWEKGFDEGIININEELLAEFQQEVKSYSENVE